MTFLEEAQRTELIRSRWSGADPDARWTVFNPATGCAVTRVQGAGAAEVDAAVRAAHAGFQSWSRRPARERGRVLLQAARMVRKHADELAELLTAENGKPVGQARLGDVESCIGSFEFFGAQAPEQGGTAHDFGAILSTVLLEPYGVVAGILPFNWPPVHFGAKVAPALAVGNAIVLKPGEQAPLTVLRLAELVSEVLPDDILHVVPGTAAVGAALVGHPLVRKLSFTGAPDTARRVLKLAADNLTPSLLELGGKNPLLIFADADLDRATSDVLEGGFFNKGEACTAVSRVLVQRGVYPQVVDQLARAVRRFRVGDGADAATHIGPQISRVQQQRVLEYLELGRTEGAEVVAQAALPTDPRLRDGYFVPPTLFAGVRPDMRIAREEIFGPVVCVIPFDEYDEAIAIANGTDFALVASVHTRDHELAMRACRDIEAGMVFVNNYYRAFLGSPFGGTKASGYGREHALETLREFGYSKAIRTLTGRGQPPRWFAVDEVKRAGE